MILTERFTNFNRTDEELEELLLFTIAVAGKNASLTARNIDYFLKGKERLKIQGNPGPFDYVWLLVNLGLLREQLEDSRLGKYTLLEKGFCFAALALIDLKTCSLQELEKIPGIGPKSARMFLLHTRPNQRLAVLDTHVLRFMREEIKILTPKSTPTSTKYKRLEEEFLDYCDYTEQYHKSHITMKNGNKIPLKFNGKKLDIAAFDLEIWKQYRINLT